MNSVHAICRAHPALRATAPRVGGGDWKKQHGEHENARTSGHEMAAEFSFVMVTHRFGNCFSMC